jgi:hypothetical protein
LKLWKNDGTWVAAHDALRDRYRVVSGHDISSSETMLDSQTVKSSAYLNQDIGYDKAKLTKGRKRHMTVDCLGLILRVFVSAASRRY